MDHKENELLLFNTCIDDLKYASKNIRNECYANIKAVTKDSVYDVLYNNFIGATYSKTMFVGQSMHCIAFIRDLSGCGENFKDMLEINVINCKATLLKKKTHYKYIKLLINQLRYSCKNLITVVYSNNTEAIKTYEALGFKRISDITESGHLHYIYSIKGFME